MNKHGWLPNSHDNSQLVLLEAMAHIVLDMHRLA